MSLPLASDEQRDLIISVSTHRGDRRLSPLEVAVLFRRAIDAGATVDACAEAVGLTGPTMVRRFLRLLELAPDLREVVGWGRTPASLAFTAGSEIARVPSDQQLFLAPEALRVGLTTSEIKAVVQRLLRSDRTPAQAVEEILKTRPRIERRHVFIGRFDEAAPLDRLAGKTETQRNRALTNAVFQVFGVIPLGARLTRTGFVITADDSLARSLHGDTDFEETILAALEKSEHLSDDASH